MFILFTSVKNILRSDTISCIDEEHYIKANIKL